MPVEQDIAMLRQMLEAMRFEQQSILSRLESMRTTIQKIATDLERLEGKVDSIPRR